MTKDYCNSIHIVEQDIIIPLPVNHEPPSQEAPVFAEDPDNNNLLFSLAEAYCANDPEMDQLIAQGKNGARSYAWEIAMLKKIAAGVKAYANRAKEMVDRICGEAVPVLSDNIIPFPQEGR